LYFLGLLRLYTRGSALIGWAKDDAEEWNWYLPTWLRLLPELHVAGDPRPS
jgi:hypothetical protein